ncbi:MAG: transferase, partial [Phycisphaeraceae bacterium]|nr:transferase [Phycisphaeraceae bacterium]
MQKLLIAGSSGQAKITIDIIERVGTHRIVGLLDASRPVGEETFGYPIVGTTQDVAACAAKLGADSVFVAIGDNSVRKRVVEEIRAAAPDLDFPSVIHPSACIGRDVNVGPGVFMSAGVIINSAVEVAEGSLISANASLDHDSSIG